MATERSPHRAAHAAFLAALSLTMIACVGDSETPPSEPPTEAPCEGERAEHFGCPGMPCAHGWCAVGQCEGELRDDGDVVIDPGVCCIDDDCDAPEA
ncbi:MAG: hypothetical protein IPK74_35085 [Deltaproteobacteria bacterium]|nr:hypothetical protein [Deltaproteobacteria bacterium]